jgi:hypothetical protein
MPRLVADPSPEARIAAGKQRVLDRIIRNDDGCWEWRGSSNTYGYGGLNVRLGGRGAPKVMLLAHRVSYEHHVGPIPEGTEIDHLCRNPACSRPDHLEAVTHRENIKRAIFKDDTVPCPQGHTGNFTRTPGNGRQCNDCRPRWR